MCLPRTFRDSPPLMARTREALRGEFRKLLPVSLEVAVADGGEGDEREDAVEVICEHLTLANSQLLLHVCALNLVVLFPGSCSQ